MMLRHDLAPHNLLVLLVVAAVTLLCCGCGQDGGGGDADGPAVAWSDASFDALLAGAQAAGKPLMIDFYATWCGPCKRLDQVTYRDPAVAAYVNEHLIAAKRDVEAGEGIDLAQRYAVYNYPTIVFLNPDGREIDRQIGFLPPAEYLQVVKDYLAGVNTLDDYLRRVAAAPGDAELNYLAGEKLTHRLRAQEAHRYLEEAIGLDPLNEQGLAAPALFALADLHRKLAVTRKDDSEWPEAVRYARRVIDEFPTDANVDEALGRIAYYHRQAGDMEAAAGAYREIIARKPGDAGALNAFAWFCAKQGHALEEATEKAEQAVKLSDGDPGIIDTLAEVYFARGMFDEAIATIQEAIAKQPDDDYLRQQLQKFEEAKGARARI